MPRWLRARGRTAGSVAAILLLAGCGSQGSFFRPEPPAALRGASASATRPAEPGTSATPPVHPKAMDPDPALGMVIVGGRWLATPLVCERTATTLLVNGVDAAPVTPDELSGEEPPPAGEPDSFDAVCLLAFRRYFDDCVEDGVAGLAAARATLLATLRGSEYVESVEESDEFIVAHSPGGKALSIELVTDEMDVEVMRRGREIGVREHKAAAAERRRKGLDEIEARLRFAERSGSLVLISGLDGNATYPPAVGRGKFIGIHRVMREPGLDREARIRKLLPIVRSAPLAEQIADRFEPEPIAK